MDFLKKYYDKILLAMAFVLVIISGFILVQKVNSLSQRLNQPDAVLVSPKKADYKPLDTHKYVEALDAVQHPFVWASSPVDLFRADTGLISSAVSNKPIAYLRLEQLPFDLLFKAYSWDAAKARAFNFQISLRDLKRAYFVAAVGDEVKDQFGDTGYRISKFERKVESVFNPSVGYNMEADHSEVTLERPGENAIVLERDKVHLQTESVATIVCQEDPQNEIQVRRNQSINCPSNTYIIVDMNDKRMVIKNINTAKEDTIEKFYGVTMTSGAVAVPTAVLPRVEAPVPVGGGAPVAPEVPARQRHGR